MKQNTGIKLNLNTYANVRQPQVNQSVNFNDWLCKIKDSEYSDIITKARNGEVDYNDTKLSLPCITYNFTYNKYKKDENIIASTGLLYIDIDDPSFDVELLPKQKVYAYYKSFGGQGYSIIIRISGITKDNFKHNYLMVCEDLGIANYVDISAIKHSQYNILSYDTDIYTNADSYIYAAVDIASLSIVIKKKEEDIYTNEGGIRFNNLDKIDLEGNSYTVNWEGVEYVNCFIPIKKREAGQRNSFLLSYTNNLVWLNPQLSREAIGSILSHVNQKGCYPPVDEQKVYNVVNSILKYKEDGTLRPIIFNKKRKFIFDKKLKLTKREKWRIMIDEISNKKMEVSQQKLYDILESWDFDKHGKITQRAVYKNHSISKKTVEKYWSEFKNYVSDLNNSNIRIEEVIIKESPIDKEVMIGRIEQLDRYEEYASKASMISYVLERRETLELDAVKHFYNEILNLSA